MKRDYESSIEQALERERARTQVVIDTARVIARTLPGTPNHSAIYCKCTICVFRAALAAYDAAGDPLPTPQPTPERCSICGVTETPGGHPFHGAGEPQP